MAVKNYKLTRGFWNGKVLIPRGTIHPFEEGEAPKSAQLVEEAKAEPETETDEPKDAPAAKPVAKPTAK